MIYSTVRDARKSPTRLGVASSALAAALAAVLIAPTAHAQTTYTWQGGAGNTDWNQVPNWLKTGPNPSLIPDSADADARHLTATTITLTDARTINSFESTDSGGTFALSGGSLTGQGAPTSLVLVQGATLLNSGTLNNVTADLTNIVANSGGTVGFVGTALRFFGVAEVSNSSYLYVRGSQTLGGAATINLSGNAQFGIEGTTALTVGSSTNINGRNGTLGGPQRIVGGAQTLINNGALEAETSGTTFTVQGDNLGGVGTLRARNGGNLILRLSGSNAETFTGLLRSGDAGSGLNSTLSLDAGNLVLSSGGGVGGTLNVLSGSQFVLNNGARVTGGTITGDTGSTVVLNSGILANTSANLSNVVVNSGGTVGLLDNTLQLAGTLDLSNASYLYVRGNQTLGGAGTAVVSDNAQFGIEGDTTLTVASATTIASGVGSGTLGGPQRLVGGAQSLVNNGMIRSGNGGAVLTVNVTNLSGSGLIEATQGGTVNLSLGVNNAGTFTGILRSGDTLSNVTPVVSTIALNAGNLVLGSVAGTGGTLRIVDGSRFVLNSAQITGGTIFAESPDKYEGSLAVLNSGVLSSTSATFNNAIIGTGGGTVGIVDSAVTLTGTMFVAENAYLYTRGDQTLGGTGTVDLANNAQFGIEGTTTLTIGSGVDVNGGNSVLGGGQRLVGGNQTLINNGLIGAQTNGTTFQVATGNLTNNNLIRAGGGGILALSGAVDNTNGTIRADGVNSRVLSTASNLTGGRVVGANGGVFTQTGGTLSGVTTVGRVALNNARIAGVTLDDAQVQIAGAINYVNVRETQTIGGNGTVTLTDTQLGIEGNTALTVGSGVVVRGENSTLGGAQRFVGGDQSLVNLGAIVATGGTFTLDTDTPIANFGILHAETGGTLASTTDVTQSAGLTEANGTLRIGTGGAGMLSLAGGIVGGTGTLNANVAATGGNTKTVTGGLVGTVGTLGITGGLSLDANSIFRLDVASLSSFDILNVTGASSLGNAILEINLLPGVNLLANDTLPNFFTGGGFTGQFAAIRANAGYEFAVDYDGSGSPTAARVTTVGSNATVVPEPNTGLLALLAAPAIGLIVYRKRKAV